MTAANFPSEVGDELVFEGGYVDDPADPGGATDFGITLATLSHFLGRAASIADLQGMDDSTKAAIYRTMFWNVIQGDSLPSGVDLVTFDMAVNGGPRRAAEMLQMVVGASADGVIGPLTLKAVAAQPTAAVINSFTAARTSFYEKQPDFARFGDGWLNRVHECQVEALALVAR